MSQPTLLDRFRGCLIGQAIGDAVGAPLEGSTAGLIREQFGSATDFVADPPVDCLFYTDDTQMMIGIAETLVEHGEIDPDKLSLRFIANYDLRRGYGPGCRRILEQGARGENCCELAQTIFPGGSYGNGAAMRIAPVGLLFAGRKEKLIEQTRQSALPTHAHVLAIEGATLVAAAITYCLTEPEFERARFFDFLEEYVQEEEYQWQLSVARQLELGDPIVTHFGNSIEAHKSVMTAITCFALEPSDYAGVIARAIASGNDTDTLAAMAGAICGAHLGIQAIPEHLIKMLEDDNKALSYIDQLAHKLYDLADSNNDSD
ncbi:MAG: ADP-ribosylglycohydrolase family protein [Sedimentisphaerales bacterium]|nr:ADP-ribosylglycohydrolase family protein [Sedimentisphaerales bacterium]